MVKQSAGIILDIVDEKMGVDVLRGKKVFDKIFGSEGVPLGRAKNKRPSVGIGFGIYTGETVDRLSFILETRFEIN